MDIRNWAVDDILALPDHAFGRRFPVWCMAVGASGGYTWDIAEVPFPDRCVLWGFGWWVHGLADNTCRIRLGLGDQVPTSLAQMNALDPFRMGIGLTGGEPRVIWAGQSPQFTWFPMRDVFEPQGKRLVLEVDADETYDVRVGVGAVVSTLPRRIPDWLISVPQSP